MKESKTRLSIRNLSYSIVLQMVTIATGFIIPRFMLQTYGSNIFGLTSSITQALGYLSIIEAGLGAAAIQALYQPMAKKNWTKVNAILSAVHHFFKKIGLYFSLLLIVLAVFYPLIIGEQLSYEFVIIIVLIMGLQYTTEFLIIGKYRVLLTADQRVSVFNGVQAFFLIIITVLKLVLILSEANVILVMFVPSLINLFRGYFLKIYMKKVYQNTSFNESTSKSVLNKRKPVLIHQLTGLVVYNTPTLLLTIFTDLKTVSIYTVYNLVFSSLYVMLTSTFSNATVASFGQLLASVKIEKVRENYSIFELIYYMVLTIVYTTTFFGILPFVKLFTGEFNNSEFINWKIAALFTAVSVLNNLRVPANTMINAIGHFRETQYRSLIEAVINLIVSIILLTKYGIYGVLCGGMVSFLYRVFDIIFYTNNKILFQSAKYSLVRGGRNILIGGLLTVMLTFFIPIEVLTWKDWILSNSLVIFFVALVTVGINFLFEPALFKKTVYKIIGR